MKHYSVHASWCAPSSIVHTIMVDTACEHACLPDQPEDGLQMTLTFATLLLEEVALVWVASADVLTFSSHDLGLVETLMVPVTGRSRGRWSGPAHLACQHKERRPPTTTQQMLGTSQGGRKGQSMRASHVSTRHCNHRKRRDTDSFTFMFGASPHSRIRITGTTL